jgi:hypothetical protein
MEGEEGFATMDSNSGRISRGRCAATEDGQPNLRIYGRDLGPIAISMQLRQIRRRTNDDYGSDTEVG